MRGSNRALNAPRSKGEATHFGSVIAGRGVQYVRGGDTFVWNEGLLDGWPSPGWGMPRVIVTRWETVP